MNGERVWYEVALETFCREAKKRASRTTLELIAATGLKIDGPWPAGLAAEKFAPLVNAVCADAFPRLDQFDGQFKWGTTGAETYFSTFVGKALLPLIRAFGPHRYLGMNKRMTRHANTFQNISTVQLAPTKYRLEIDDPETGALTFGGLFASLGFLKLEGLSWSRVAAPPGTLAIEVEWK